MSEIITWLSWHNLVSKTNGGKPEVLNKKVNASMSAMPSLPELPQQKNIVDMLALTFLFKTSGLPPFVLLTILCLESHVIPLLDFRLGSHESYRKFPTYFVGVFCSNLEYILLYIYTSETPNVYRKFTQCFVGFFCFNLECILSYIDIVNFWHLLEIYDIYCRLLLKSLKIICPAFQQVTEDTILNLCLCICVWLIIGFCNLVTSIEKIICHCLIGV